MGAQVDQVKGRAKEAAGIVTGNKDLESEGKADRRTGATQAKVNHAKASIAGVFDTTNDKVEGAIHKVSDTLHRR